MEQTTVLPKNVRQIGEIQGNRRIYVEDYVMTFIRRKEQQEENEGFLGVFLGETQERENETVIFIRGLMEVSQREEEETASGREAEQLSANEKMSARETDCLSADKKTSAREKEHLDAQESDDLESAGVYAKHKGEDAEQGSGEAVGGSEMQADDGEAQDGSRTAQGEEPRPKKRSVRGDCRENFGSWEILGCCVIGTYPVEPMKRLVEEIPDVCRLLYHLQEQEENIYWTSGGRYEKISGYFVFYEENRLMQEYMAEVFGEKSLEQDKIADRAIKNFREKVKIKDQVRITGMMKLASSFFVLTVLVIGAVAVNRIERIREPRRQVQETRENSSAEKEAANPEDTRYQTAEVVNLGGGVTSDQTGIAGNISAEAGTADSGIAGNISAEAGTAGSGIAGTGTVGGGSAENGTAAIGTAVLASDNSALTAEAGGSLAGVTDISENLTISGGTGVEENAGVPAGAETGMNTGVSAGTETGMNTGVSAGAETGMNTGVPTGAETGTNAGVPAGAETGMNTGVSAGAETGANTGTPTGTETGAAALAADGTAEAGAGTEAEAAEVLSRQVQSAYIIREGDTLADICQKYYGGLENLEALCTANAITDANLIHPGQKIVLP